jgi:dTDP-4-amino-4,6-dideoxygalactose transaminase
MPMMKNIPVTIPLLGKEEAEAASEAILSGWVTQGPRVEAFEKAFASYVGTSHACAVSSCTAALHLALMAVGVGAGDVALTVSHSFIATANSIRHCGAEPVFLDIDPLTRNMDPEILARTLSEDFIREGESYWYKDVNRLAVGESPLCNSIEHSGRLAAILIVHQVGMPCDMRGILRLAHKYKVPVVEDAACAIGSEITIDGGKSWEKIGRPHGEIACFSFHPRKVITTGDGGMLTTNDSKYDHFFRLGRHHGMSVSDRERHASDQVIFEEYLGTGYNYRMTDIQTAIGIEQLKRLPEIVRKRRSLAIAYTKALSKIPGLTITTEPDYSRANRQSYIVRLKDPSKQENIIRKLKTKGISVRRGIMCAHLETPYSGFWSAGCLPHSENALASDIILPLYPSMTSEDIFYVVSAFREALS